MLLFISFAIIARNSPVAKTPLVLGLVLCAFVLVGLYFGGLRGSRGYTVWNLFWAIGIVHFYLRPIPRIAIPMGILCLVVFMYGYGFYKWGGRDAVQSLFDSRTRSEWVDDSNKGFLRTVLFDMGRCDVQAYMLYRLWHIGDYQHAYGRTYLGAATLFIPRSVWPDRPPSKTKEGTEIRYGQGTYIQGRFVSSWCFGLAGETMLNFPPLMIPVAYGLFGFVVKRTRQFALNLGSQDVRILFVPFLIAVCFFMLVWDSDNVIVFLVKFGSVPFLALLFSSKSAQVADRHEGSCEDAS